MPEHPNLLPTIEIYSSLECPYAYLTTYRLRQAWPAFRGKVRLAWRALALEYVNRQSYPKPLFDMEFALFRQIEPALPWQPWRRPDWEWPTTYWPAFEALACAQAQGNEPAFEMSWALREAYFDGNRCLSLRHEILAVAGETAAQGKLDLDQFTQDWDSGRYKSQILAESRHGWEVLKVEGSATLLLPDGRRFTNPATGEIDFDEALFQLRSFTPYPGDPAEVYRELLDSASQMVNSK
jgi:predicted DsbA family dithiol-disulfide isomerase